jgi:protein phosphatase
MGSPLPKPVESGLIERQEGKAFRVAAAEVNGYRNSMEDAHLIYMNSDSGFFGVFDGHGGDQCSTFIAKELEKELTAKGLPEDDEAVKKLIFGVDSGFLQTGQSSGSTGTMAIVNKSRGSSPGKIQLRLANVGDSRIILGKRDGTIVDGGGSDKGLTTDHKPDHPNERQRIYRCGGYVVDGENGGPARVNGELSVSRCFGDASFKETGGPGPEDRPVTSNPELFRFDCDESDFLLLVCDGVSEGSFSNPDVVKFVAQSLQKDNDPGKAARGVCHKAIECNSKDNITCMIILFSGSGNGEIKKSHEFIPGSVASCSSKPFMTAYEAMAKRAGLTLAQAVEMRYEALMEDISDPTKNTKELKEEAEAIGTPTGIKGSKERSAWFRKWEENLSQKQSAAPPDQNDLMLQLVRQGMLGGMPPSVLSSLLGGGGPDDGDPGSSGKCIRRIRAPDAMTLRKAVRKHPALDWDERMTRMAGTEGEVQQDDDDGTSKVNFPSLQMSAWLPTSALIACNDAPDMSRPRGSAPAIQTAAAGRGARAAPAPRPASDQCLRQALAAQSGPGRRSILPRPDMAASSAMGSGDPVGDSRGPRLPAVTGRGRTPSPGEATAGIRMAAGGGRASSPLDGAGVASRSRRDLGGPSPVRATGRVAAGNGQRGSRSMPP